MSIDHRQLRFFIEVASVGSINKAAERLHIAQPALSRRMHQLEHELGAKLLIRHSSGVTLTAAGRKLLGRAAAIVDELQRLRHFIDEPADTAFQQLQIGMVPGPSLLLLARLIAGFHRERPEVLLQVVDGTTPHLSEMVLNRGIDVAIVTDPEPNDRLVAETLWHEAIFLVGPPGYQSNLTALLALPFVMPTPNTAIQSTIEAALSHFGATIRPDLTVAATATVKQLVGKGGAFTVLPFSTVADAMSPDVFTTVQVPGIRVRRDMIRRADETWDQAMDTLASIVRTTATAVIQTYPDGSLIATRESTEAKEAAP